MVIQAYNRLKEIEVPGYPLTPSPTPLLRDAFIVDDTLRINRLNPPIPYNVPPTSGHQQQTLVNQPRCPADITRTSFEREGISLSPPLPPESNNDQCPAAVFTPREVPGGAGSS